MSDITPEFIAPPEDAPTVAAPEVADEPTPQAKSDLADRIKAMESALRKANKEAEKYRLQVREYEDASKSEAEKAAARAEAAEKALAEVTSRAMRLEVATEVGLPADLHEFLTGSDEESLRSQAEKLKAATAAQRTTPRPDPTQGAKPNASGPTQLTKADLASMTPAQIDQALTEGRLVDVLAGRA